MNNTTSGEIPTTTGSAHDPALRVRDVAAALNMSERVIHRLLRLRERGLPVSLPYAIRVGNGRGQWRFPVRALESFLAEKHGAPEFLPASEGSEAVGAAVHGEHEAASSGKSTRRVAHARRKRKGVGRGSRR